MPSPNQNENAAGLKGQVPAAFVSSDALRRASNTDEDNAAISVQQESWPAADALSRSRPAPLLARAKVLLEAGFALVLLGNHKSPVEPGWTDNPVKTFEEARGRWSGEKHRSSNLGLLMGGEYFAVDADIKTIDGATVDGRKQFDQLRFQWDFMIPTRTHRTRSGGLHFIYRKPVDVVLKTGAGTVDTAVDSRAEGGQIVAPGSIVEGGLYEVVDDSPIADACPELIALLRKAEPPSPGKALAPQLVDDPVCVAEAVQFLINEALPAVSGAKGNDTTRDVALQVKDKGASERMCFNLMSATYNEQKCSPPWSLPELQRIVQNAYRYGKNPIGSGSVLTAFDLVAPSPDLIDLPALKSNDGFQTVFFDDDIDLEDEPDPIIEGLIPAGSVGFIYGPSWKGKSLIAALAAHCIATGSAFGDRDVTPGGVLIVATEGHSGVKKRVKALQQTLGKTNAPLAFSKAILNLADGDQGAKLILMECLKFRSRFGSLPSLVVIDTLAAAAIGLDENSVKDISRLLAVLRRLQVAVGRDATVLCIHHAGKSSERGLRGSSALLANTDFTIKVDDGTISVEKNRDDERREDIHFTAERVFLGLKKSGKAINSAVARLTDAPRARLMMAEKNLSDSQVELLKLLRRIFVEPAHGSDIFGVPFGTLLEAAVAEGITKAAKPKSQHTGISAMLKVLKNGGLAENERDQWRPVSTGGGN